MDIGVDLTLLGGSTTRLGSGVAAARASFDSTAPSIRTGGKLVLIAGVGPNAGAASGIFDSKNNVIGLESPPIEAIFFGGGAYLLYVDPARVEAYIQSGTLRNFESLQRYLIFAANEETRRDRVLRGQGSADDTSLPSCN